MRRRRATRELGELIQAKFLRHAAGVLDISIDDIVIAYRAEFGVSLSTAQFHVRRTLDATLKHLAEDEAWLSVPVTDYWFRQFVDRDRDACDATSDDELRRSIAGLGRGQRRVGVHFLVDEGDLLFLMAVIHGLRNGQGKVDANVRRIELAAEVNQLTADGVQVLAATTGGHMKATSNRMKRVVGTVTHRDQISLPPMPGAVS